MLLYMEIGRVKMVRVRGACCCWGIMICFPLLKRKRELDMMGNNNPNPNPVSTSTRALTLTQPEHHTPIPNVPQNRCIGTPNR